MLKSADGWDQVTAFVALTMQGKMERARVRQRRPMSATTQHPMPDLTSPTLVFAASNPATEAEKDDPGALLLKNALNANVANALTLNLAWYR